MSVSLRKTIIAASILTLLLFASVRQVFAQETATLIIYTEALGGDATFTYSASPIPLSNFQIDTITTGAGGVRIFNLTAGTYAITQNTLPANWTLKEIFLGGTGIGTINQTQAKATVTVTSASDVFYLRFTNEDQTVIPEFPNFPVNLLIVILLSLVAVFSFKKHRRPAGVVFSTLLSACILFVSTGLTMANPDRFFQLGTAGDDTQIQLGTINRDLVVQFGFSGEDTQYVACAAEDDVIVQNSGTGNDQQTASAGSGNDYVIQEGGQGDDTIFTELGLGNDNVTQNGGFGNDNMDTRGDDGDDLIIQRGGEGDDQIKAYGGRGSDKLEIYADTGNDLIVYDVSEGIDIVYIDGGEGVDTLTVNQLSQNFTMLNKDGASIFKIGEGGSAITVLNVAHGSVIGAAGAVFFQW